MIASREFRGRSARDIAASIEGAIRVGTLRPGEKLPTVRGLAAELGVSAVTVHAAYRTLRGRGLTLAAGRNGTCVGPAARLPHPAPAVPEGIRNLALGNPDPALLPAIKPALARLEIDPFNPNMYGGHSNLPGLIEYATAMFAADGIPGHSIAVVGGALDGIERALVEHLSPGDQVAVEDPLFPRVLDLLSALQLEPEPVALDDQGMLPEALTGALARGARACILTPRAQNPTGASLTSDRASELRAVVKRHSGVLVIEDDYAASVSGTEAQTLCTERLPAWIVVRSVSKVLGPDLRLALLAGDAATVSRLAGRQRLATGWVSHVLQRLVLTLFTDPDMSHLLQTASERYGERRRALIDRLAERGIPASGKTGLNVWVSVPDEDRTVRALLGAGWAVSSGSRFRLRTPPAIRVTTSTLLPEESDLVAECIAQSMAPVGRTLSA